jgi:hypothetical protein
MQNGGTEGALGWGEGEMDPLLKHELEYILVDMYRVFTRKAGGLPIITFRVIARLHSISNRYIGHI